MTQRILITGPERRRHWSDEEKLSILVEAFAPNVSQIEIARRHGISTGLLYTWRRKAMALGDQPAPGGAKPVFLPAVVAAGETAPPLPVAIAHPAPTIEVHLKGGVKVRIEAGMPEVAITAALKALR
jgi:transposase